MKKKTKREIYDEHGFRGVPLTHAVEFINVYPGPIKEGDIPVRAVKTLARKGWIRPLTTPKEMGDLRSFEITGTGLAALKKAKEAEDAYHAQPKRNRGTLQNV